MRVLIAGCGDLGNRLAQGLLHDGHTVFGLKRNTASLPVGVRPISADLLDPQTLNTLPPGIDVLVFMPTPATRDEAGYNAIFIRALENLFLALDHEPGQTVLISSTAVFGESGGAVVTEETDPSPSRFNGRILLQMEQLAASLTSRLTVARISGIYGPGREHLIDMARREDLEIQQFPPFYTNRIHSDDAAAALRHLMYIENPLGLYLLSDDLPAPRYEVMSWLAQVQGNARPAGLTIETADNGKQVSNRRLRDSGFSLKFPDYRVGYADILRRRSAV